MGEQENGEGGSGNRGRIRGDIGCEGEWKTRKTSLHMVMMQSECLCRCRGRLGFRIFSHRDDVENDTALEDRIRSYSRMPRKIIDDALPHPTLVHSFRHPDSHHRTSGTQTD